MSSNKSAKERLIKLYGERDFLDAMGIRILPKNTRYKSKGQYKRMKQLSYHHIVKREHGGKATVENGALLTVENHAAFHKLPIETQNRLNKAFQEYKREYKKVSVEFTDESVYDIMDSSGISLNITELDVGIEIDANGRQIMRLNATKPKPYNRAKVKEELRRKILSDEEHEEHER